jgi:hypothetical protein
MPQRAGREGGISAVDLDAVLLGYDLYLQCRPRAEVVGSIGDLSQKFSFVRRHF